MEDRRLRCSRRKFLASAAGALALTGSSKESGASAPLPACRTRPPRLSTQGRKPLALVCTVYRPLSDAYHLAARFLHGFAVQNELHVPAYYLSTICVDQTPVNDLSRELGREFGIPVTRSIAEALTTGGKLGVEGVLLVGEHGNYPRNDKGQVLYPRLEMLEQIANVFRKLGQSVPVFNHKGLSTTFARARQMIAWAEELRFPLMAGSFLPFVERRPELELPSNTPIEEALVTTHGPLEIAGFHALEGLQALIERRRGGETGVRSVTCLSGQAVWRAGDAGRWSWDLLEAALAHSETVNPGDIRRNTGSMSIPGQPALPPTAFLIDYRDGTRGTVLLLNGHVSDCCFAAKIKGEPRYPACRFVVPPPPGARFFDPLALQTEKFFLTRSAPNPVERTLLSTGILDGLMESHRQCGMRRETEVLKVAYQVRRESVFSGRKEG
jgi:hypothetical protein